MRHRRILVSLVAAAAIAGCGSSRTVTDTVVHTTTSPSVSTSSVARTEATVPDVPTVTQTVTTVKKVVVKAKPKPKPTDYASQYPLVFESTFDQSCIAGGGDSSICTCALNNIEHAVPYYKFVAAAHAILTGNPPEWYRAAAEACG
jgi:hypothetical protein